MAPGSGTHSYALNSWVQSLAIQRLHPILRDAINHFKLPRDGNIRVADFGCSSGANTLTFANIISIGFFANGASEIQYFFNDLSTNDFNTLFQQMPPLNVRFGGNDNSFDVNSLPLKSGFGRSTKKAERKIDTRIYYAAAVPGSFYERLFPSSSLHLVLSTNSLHWIPHLPEVVQNKASIAYNKGQTFINAQNPKALEACGEVFQENFQKFLVHRAIELALGGLLVLLFRGRWTNLPTLEIVDEPPHRCMDFGMEAWEASWDDLIFEGLINAELRDSFNIPIYHASMEDVRMAIDKTNVFVIQKLELLKQAISTEMSKEVQNSLFENPNLYGDLMSNAMRATFGELVEVHIGLELANIFFQRLKENFVIRVPKTNDAFNKVSGEFLIVLVSK
ncbi:unnamed protein product [Sphagnum tenellum]